MQTEEPRPEAPERHITIAFDGACKGNPGPGGWAAILVNDQTKAEKIIQGRDPTTTNNKMELQAAIAALNALKPGAFVHMLGDSQYVVKGMTEWLPNWKANGWRTAQRKPVLNVEQWQALELATARHAAVTWEWVRGHDGHELNERVDALASEQARWAGVVGAAKRVRAA